MSAEKTVEILGAGYLRHPSNDQLRERLRSQVLIPKEFVAQLRTLVYRLVVSVIMDTDPHLVVGQGSPPKGIAPWLADAPDLDGSQIDSADIDSALTELAVDRTKTDELGRIHQQLVGFNPEIDLEEGRLKPAVGGTKRSPGVFYTPDVLVESLLDHALEPLIEQVIARKAPDDAEQALLSLRILDPAVGSGRFLVAAARRLTRRVAQMRSARRMPTLTAARDVAQRCLYGVDIDPTSVDLARLALWIEAGRPGGVDKNWPGNLRVGDSLCGATSLLLKAGIPDIAFEPVGDDDSKLSAELRKANRQEREENPAFESVRPLVWDGWCAAHTLPKKEGSTALTQATLRNLDSESMEARYNEILNGAPSDPSSETDALLAAIADEKRERQFFHWALEFPGASFDLVVANPPFANAIERDLADRTSRISSARTPLVVGAADVAYRFLAAAADWVRPGGWVAMIQPRAALNAKALESFRAQPPGGLKPRLLCAIDKSDLFQGADVYVSLIVLGPPGACTIPDPDDPGHDRWVWVDRVPSNWYVAARGKTEPEPPSAIHQSLGEVFDIAASMTTSEAYAVKPYIGDSQKGRGQKLITTGLIDPGKTFWGLEDCRYLGAHVRHPRITPNHAMPASLQRRLIASKRPKVLVGGLGSRVEAFFDVNGQCQGAVSTYSIFHPTDDLESLRMACEFLNRPETSERMRLELGANALGGGSITIKKQWLKELPFQPE